MTQIIAPSIFAADPAAHVFDGRLYLYVSYDEPFTNCLLYTSPSPRDS